MTTFAELFRIVREVIEESEDELAEDHELDDEVEVDEILDVIRSRVNSKVEMVEQSSDMAAARQRTRSPLGARIGRIRW